MIEMYIALHINYPLLLKVYNESRFLSIDFRKILVFLYQIPWISVHWEPWLSLRTDGQTDRRRDIQTWRS